MGSQLQGRWIRSAPGQLPRQRSAPEEAAEGGGASRRDPRLIGGLFAAAWAC
jgi:hypothetical protein